MKNHRVKFEENKVEKIHVKKKISCENKNKKGHYKLEGGSHQIQRKEFVISESEKTDCEVPIKSSREVKQQREINKKELFRLFYFMLRTILYRT